MYVHVHCYRKLGIPHNLFTTNKIEQNRKVLDSRI